MSLQFYNSSVYGYLRGDPPVSAKSFSIHAWVKANDNDAFMNIASIGDWGVTDNFNNLGLANDWDNRLVVEGKSGGFFNSATAANSFDSYFGVWTPVTGHYPSSAGIYCSIAGGTDSTPTTETVESLSTPDAFVIGGDATISAGNFDGRISIVSVWNIDLSDSQEEELSTKLPSAVSFYNNCVAWYDFRTNDANILKNKKNPGTYDLTAYGSTTPQYYSDDPTAFGPDITSVASDLYGNTRITVTGTGFGATQGNGDVWLSPTDSFADANKVVQTIVSWSDTSIVFTVVRGALNYDTTLYLFVEENGGTYNASGEAVTVRAGLKLVRTV